MIYDNVDQEEPIHQGDIFINIPKLEFSLENILFEQEEDDAGLKQASWTELLQDLSLDEIAEKIQVTVPIKAVSAIVATQDCDAFRSPDITLCEIRKFGDVEGQSKNKTSPGALVKIITRQSRLNLKWFYLPPDEELGFQEKMAVDFLVTLRLQRKELENLRHLRKKRLNSVADEHFRERIGEFFRRYPYDEWYPLDKEEFALYKKEHSAEPPQPFPWQE
jgi:hypothetical protein